MHMISFFSFSKRRLSGRIVIDTHIQAGQKTEDGREKKAVNEQRRSRRRRQQPAGSTPCRASQSFFFLFSLFSAYGLSEVASDAVFVFPVVDRFLNFKAFLFRPLHFSIHRLNSSASSLATPFFHLSLDSPDWRLSLCARPREPSMLALPAIFTSTSRLSTSFASL